MSDPAFDLIYDTDDIDRDTDEDMVEEMYYSQIQRHPYYVLTQAVTLDIYGEPEGEPTYTALDPAIPIHIKLEPEVELLDRYGYDRVRDAVAWFSTKILREAGLVPKVGDRIDFIFLNEAGSTVREQFEIHEISPWDFQRQGKNFYQVTAAMDRTHKAMKPVS